MSRIVSITIDAAEWWFIEQLLDAGELPALARLRARAATCRLQGARAYTSDQAWSQFLTGRSAEQNRHWGLMHFDTDEYTVTQGGPVPAAPFYALPGKKVIAFDMPHSALSGDVEGAQVTAWGTHGPQYPRASRPQGLLREIDDTFGVHPAFETDFDTGWYHDGYIDALTDRLLAGGPQRFDILSWLTERVPDWDLLVTGVSEFHSAAHHFWHGIEPGHPLAGVSTAQHARQRVIEVTRAVDATIGNFVDDLPDDTYVVVSAFHGMGPAEDLMSLVLMPELLYRMQFGKKVFRDPDQQAWKAVGCPPLEVHSDEAWAVMHELRDSFIDSPKHRVRELLRKTLPAPLFNRIRQLAGQPPSRHITELGHDVAPESDLGLDELGDIRRSMDWQMPAWYRQFWPQMKWFGLPSFDNGHIRINLRGREKQGIVDLADYRRTCEEVVAEIAKCRNVRSGEDVIDDVVYIRADDPLAPDGPDADIVIRWKGAADAIEHPTVGMIGPFPYLRTGQHTRNGFAFIAGPGIHPSDLGEHDALDLPPTIVELLGEMPPGEMPGTSMAASLQRTATTT